MFLLVLYQVYRKSVSRIFPEWKTYFSPLYNPVDSPKNDPVGWDCRIHKLYFCRGVRLPKQVTPLAGVVEYTNFISADR